MVRILICGLNGSGKSTLGRALARKLEVPFIDNEDLFFPKTDPFYLYAAPRSKAEAQMLLKQKIAACPEFVFASVRGDYGEEFLSMYQCAIWMRVPCAVRMQRLRDRSFSKFGRRMLPGGDLYVWEKEFLDMAASRTERYVEEWLQTLHCPIIQVDGTKPVEENLTRFEEYRSGGIGGKNGFGWE